MYCKGIKLNKSASEKNVFFSYVSLINELKPTVVDSETAQKRLSLRLQDADNEDDDEDRIKIERSKALHELVESHKEEEDTHTPLENITTITTTDITAIATTSGEDSIISKLEESGTSENPNILKLTKMKWLTEDQDGAPDSSSPSISPASSSTWSYCSRDSETRLRHSLSMSDKYLSTIIRLDKEHNMFGLSNIAIDGTKTSKKNRKDDKALFHQTAIVQLCCKKSCCRYQSKSDLPASLKCGGCRACCSGCISCYSCVPPKRGRPCRDPPCSSPCKPSPSCVKAKCIPKVICPPTSCCYSSCTPNYGLKLKLNTKPKYEPSPIEITPRSSCILHKPLAARCCTHWPPCVPPSSCFPYLLPCYWTARAGAPCSNPERCFHNPPCRGPRRRRGTPEDPCPPGGCKKDTKCSNKSCPGNNPDTKTLMDARFNKQGESKPEP